MGLTAMAVGGAFGIAAKGTMNRLMKVSLRRGEKAAEIRKQVQSPGQEVYSVGVWGVSEDCLLSLDQSWMWK